MNNQDRHFEIDHNVPSMPDMEELIPTKEAKVDSRLDYYKNYVLDRPMLVAVLIGLALEVQPYEPLQPSFFIATRIVNREEIVIKGTEEEEAHKQGLVNATLASIEHAKQCQMNRDIAANTARNSCVQSGKGSGYCRFVYEQAQSLDCPAVPQF